MFMKALEKYTEDELKLAQRIVKDTVGCNPIGVTGRGVREYLKSEIRSRTPTVKVTFKCDEVHTYKTEQKVDKVFIEGVEWFPESLYQLKVNLTTTTERKKFVCDFLEHLTGDKWTFSGYSKYLVDGDINNYSTRLFNNVGKFRNCVILPTYGSKPSKPDTYSRYVKVKR